MSDEQSDIPESWEEFEKGLADEKEPDTADADPESVDEPTDQPDDAESDGAESDDVESESPWSPEREESSEPREFDGDDEGDEDEDGGDRQLLSPELSQILGEAVSQAGAFARSEFDGWMRKVEEEGRPLEGLDDVEKYIKQMLGLMSLDPGRTSPTRPDDPNYTEEEIKDVKPLSSEELGDVPETSDDEDSNDDDDDDDVPVKVRKKSGKSAVDATTLELTISTAVKAAIEAALNATQTTDEDDDD